MASSEFAPIIGPLAKHLFGDPNPAYSSEKEWRYGAKGSLSIDLLKGTWFDFESNEGGGVLDLVAREKGVQGQERIDYLKAKGFLYETLDGGGGGGPATAQQRTIVETYDYRDEGGELLFQVCRLDPKDFRQRRPDGSGGWVWSVKGIRQVPYRLPELMECLDRLVFIVEGEKDCDRLWKRGVPATTNAGGAGKWNPTLTETFRGADVVIVPDNDPQKTHPKTGQPLFHPDGRPVRPGQDHAQAVAAALQGTAKRVRVLELWRDWPEMPPKGDVSDWIKNGGTVERLYELAETSPTWGDSEPILPVPLRSAFPINEQSIPVRDWIVPGLLLRRNLSVLVAPPSSGKSLLTLQMAIAIALGINWGGWRIRSPQKVLVINSEDDYDEMCRRLCAAARDMRVDQAQLVDRIVLADAPESIVIAKMDPKNKSVIREPLFYELIATIKSAGVGVVIADPFAETFEGDENSNSEVKWAGILWREIARRTAISLWLVHHTKKYAGSMAGDADASRGGGALIGTARIMSTLFNMTEEEAKVFEIPADERVNYVRFDDAKSNHSSKGVVKWFFKKTITLDNATEAVAGDDVGVLSPWKPPGLMDDVEIGQIGYVLNEINIGPRDEAGSPTGQLYGPTIVSRDNFAGKVIERLLGATEVKAKAMIKSWIDSGLLEVVEYDDPVQRKKRKGVRVDQTKRPDARAEVYD